MPVGMGSQLTEHGGWVAKAPSSPGSWWPCSDVKVPTPPLVPRVWMHLARPIRAVHVVPACTIFRVQIPACSRSSSEAVVYPAHQECGLHALVSSCCPQGL